MSRSLSSETYAFMVERLIAARKDAGLLQQELADRLGKPQSFISKIERRERRIDVIEFIVIARAIGANPADLFGQVAKAMPMDAQL
jgi:transcriptional regulator with XRE-family HTH domain